MWGYEDVEHMSLLTRDYDYMPQHPKQDACKITAASIFPMSFSQVLIDATFSEKF